MRRRPDDLHPPRVGLAVRAGPDKGRQERVVDVDDRPAAGRQEFGREDLHVAGQHHQVDRMLASRAPRPAPPARPWRPWSPAGDETGCHGTRPWRARSAWLEITSGISASSSPASQRQSMSIRQWPCFETRIAIRLGRSVKLTRQLIPCWRASGAKAASNSSRPRPKPSLSISILMKKLPSGGSLDVLVGTQDVAVVQGDEAGDRRDQAPVVGTIDQQADVVAHE